MDKKKWTELDYSKLTDRFKDACVNAGIGGMAGASMGGSIGAVVGMRGLNRAVCATIGATIGGAVFAVGGFVIGMVPQKPSEDESIIDSEEKE